MSTTRTLAPALLACAAILASASAVGAYTGDLVPATDDDPAEGVFETSLTADEALVDLDGDGEDDNVFAFNGIVPGPLIEVDLGDIVVVHLTNSLAVPTTLHFHGIEAGNGSDGTPVVQNELGPGESFTYRFRTTRPGTFWYHPHVMPTDQVFRGLYGALVVRDPAEATLVSEGVLPAVTKTVMLSDTTVCTGSDLTGPCAESNCGPTGGMACDEGDIPFVQPDFDCRNVPMGCRVDLGTTVLVNGEPLEPSDALDIPNGDGIRLRVINASILRSFRLSPPPTGTIYRVGGEGGLLDAVRVEGGTQGTLVTEYDEGEVALQPGDRVDIVLDPQGSDQDLRVVRMLNYQQTDDLTIGVGDPILRFRLDGADSGAFGVAAGDPLRTHPAVDDPLEVLPDSGFDALLDPSTEVPGAPLGNASPLIELQANVVSFCTSDEQCHSGDCDEVANECNGDDSGPAIDGVRGLLDLGTDDYTDIPHLWSSRYAEVGDVLELTVANDTNNSHPFHLHGFSFQPVRFETHPGGETLYEWDYAEFVDNVEIRSGDALVFRVRLDDRPTWENTGIGGGGGAVGRWLFHCHIFHHANLGMISELVVLSMFGDGFESGDTSAWD